MQEIKRLRDEGLSDKEIEEKLSINKTLLNDLTPYKLGTYNADFTADGYDFSNVSTEARRKRNQRKREKMRQTNLIQDHEKDIEGAKRHMDVQKYPGMTPEQIKEEKARRRAENEARHQANPERKRKYRERRAMEDNTPEPPKPRPEYTPVTSDAIKELIEENEKKAEYLQMILEKKRAEEQQEECEKIKADNQSGKYDELERFFEFVDNQGEIDEETLGTRWPSTKRVKGKPVGDFLFVPDTSHGFLLPNGKTVRVDEDGAIGVFDANHEKHIFIFDTWEAMDANVFRAIEVKRVLKNGNLMKGQPETNYEFTVIGKIEVQEVVFKRLVEKVIISLQNLSTHKSRRTLMGIDSSNQLLTNNHIVSVREVICILL